LQPLFEARFFQELTGFELFFEMHFRLEAWQKQKFLTRNIPANVNAHEREKFKFFKSLIFNAKQKNKKNT
jgi:hypothetical protein